MKLVSLLGLLVLCSWTQAAEFGKRTVIDGLACKATAWRTYSDESKIPEGVKHHKGMRTVVESVDEAVTFKLALSSNKNEAAHGVRRAGGSILLSNDYGVRVSLIQLPKSEKKLYAVFRLVRFKDGKVIRYLGEDNENVSVEQTDFSVDISNLDIWNLYREEGVDWYDDLHDNRKHLGNRISEGKQPEGVPTGVIVSCQTL